MAFLHRIIHASVMVLGFVLFFGIQIDSVLSQDDQDSFLKKIYSSKLKQIDYSKDDFQPSIKYNFVRNKGGLLTASSSTNLSPAFSQVILAFYSPKDDEYEAKGVGKRVVAVIQLHLESIQKLANDYSGFVNLPGTMVDERENFVYFRKAYEPGELADDVDGFRITFVFDKKSMELVASDCLLSNGERAAWIRRTVSSERAESSYAENSHKEKVIRVESQKNFFLAIADWFVENNELETIFFTDLGFLPKT